MFSSASVRRLTVGATVSAMAALGSIALTAPHAEAVTCRPYTSIGVRGTADGARASLGKQLPTAVSAFKARKGTSNVTSDYVNYQASFVYPVSMLEGRNALKAKINAYIKACPRTKIALFGYSQGAHIVGDVVVGMSATQRARLQGVGLIGDPMMNPKLASSKSGTTARGGMWGRRASFPAGVYVYNVCNKGDRICASYNTVDSTAWLSGGKAYQHLNYTTSTYSPVAGSAGAWLIGVRVAR